MNAGTKIIFLHGLEGTNQGFKANLLRSKFPDIVIPNFAGGLHERMESLEQIIIAESPRVGSELNWIMIGSSFGGLMAALFACQHPELIHQVILLAPALIWPDFATTPPDPVSVPAVIYHGRNDTVIPIHLVQPLVEKVFLQHKFFSVDDDHGLHKTTQNIEWEKLVLPFK